MSVRRDEIQGDIVHVCDGIEEADNKLPNWWLWTFYLAIIFALIYWGYYHLFGVGDSPMAEYEVEQKKVLARGATVEDSAIVVLAQDPAAVAEGKRIFVDNCAQCHKANASGDIGPNLTDEFWIHGGSAGNIYTVVYKGVLDKGMLAWGSTLGPGGVTQVSAYVLTLRDTNVEGKAPQGDRWAPAPAGSGAPTKAAPSGG